MSPIRNEIFLLNAFYPTSGLCSEIMQFQEDKLPDIFYLELLFSYYVLK